MLFLLLLVLLRRSFFMSLQIHAYKRPYSYRVLREPILTHKGNNEKAAPIVIEAA